MSLTSIQRKLRALSADPIRGAGRFLSKILGPSFINLLSKATIRLRVCLLYFGNYGRFKRCTGVHIISNRGGFGHLPSEADFATSIHGGGALIVVLKSTQFPSFLTKKVIKALELDVSPLPALTGMPRHPEQEHLVVQTLEGLLGSNGPKVTTLDDFQKVSPSRKPHPSGEQAWYANYFPYVENSTEPQWLTDSRLLLDDEFGQMRERGAKEFSIGLYIRRKEVGGSRIHSSLRNGPDLEVMLSFFRAWKVPVAVFVYGDFDSSTEKKAPGFEQVHFRPDCFDREIWNSAVPLLTDAIVGHPGGGLMLGVAARKPICVLGAFGYWFGLPHSLLDFRFPLELSPPLDHLFINNPTDWKSLESLSFEDFVSRDYREVGEDFQHFLLNGVSKPSPNFSNFHPNCWLRYLTTTDLSRHSKSLVFGG